MYLDLSSPACSITENGISDLTDLISDAFHSIHDKTMLNEEFHGAAPNPAHLQVLKLRDNQISDSGVAELGEALQQSSALQALDLAGSQVCDTSSFTVQYAGMAQYSGIAQYGTVQCSMI